MVHPSKWPPQFGKIKEPPPLAPGLQHAPEMCGEVCKVYVFRATNGSIRKIIIIFKENILLDNWEECRGPFLWAAVADFNPSRMQF